MRQKTVGYICTIDGKPAGFMNSPQLYYASNRGSVAVFPTRMGALSAIESTRRYRVSQGYGYAASKYGVMRLAAGNP